MRLGLIADTHDELAYVRSAIDLFLREGCSSVLHAGDIESPYTLAEFARLTGRGIRLYWIRGDDDVDVQALVAESDRLGATLLAEGAETDIDGIKVAMIHNPYGGKGQKRPFLLHRLCAARGLDLVVYGHFHYFNIKYPSLMSGVSVVCPGGCRVDVAPQTIAVLDVATRKLDVLALGNRGSQADFAFSTILNSGPRMLEAGPGLTEQFRRSVQANLTHARRDYWRINDRWGDTWIDDWLDPRDVLTLPSRAG